MADTTIDLDKLEPREFENLCFELISQMGFKKVDWGLKMKEIDMVATLPKKDPDGFEYEELWLIVTGMNPPKDIFENLMSIGSEYFINNVLQSIYSLKNKFISHSDIPITLLFIFKENGNRFSKNIEKAEAKLRDGFPFKIRIRTWDSNYLVKLIHSYPQIAYKYFSEQSTIKSEHRKTQEELYIENRNLTMQLLKANSELEEEKRKRFIAEKEIAWKDVAFKAAHKLGNPIDAIDTYLQSLKRKINDHDLKKAEETAIQMDEILEEAKTVIAQFKSLTKIEEINLQSTNIEFIIKRYSDTAKERGIKVIIQTETDLPQVLVDPDKMKECFSELFANSNHWFNKDEKSIKISISRANTTQLPKSVDKQKKYLRITYADNGCGIENENKEKIFFPTFSKYQHGSGLGLSLLKKTIELQGGSIIEIGEFGNGACFEIYLPLVKN